MTWIGVLGRVPWTPHDNAAVGGGRGIRLHRLQWHSLLRCASHASFCVCSYCYLRILQISRTVLNRLRETTNLSLSDTRSRTQLRLARKLFLFVLLFFVGWIAAALAIVLQLSIGEMFALDAITGVTSVAHSCVVPVAYGLINPRLRQSMLWLLTCGLLQGYAKKPSAAAAAAAATAGAQADVFVNVMLVSPLTTGFKPPASARQAFTTEASLYRPRLLRNLSRRSSNNNMHSPRIPTIHFLGSRCDSGPLSQWSPTRCSGGVGGFQCAHANSDRWACDCATKSTRADHHQAVALTTIQRQPPAAAVPIGGAAGEGGSACDLLRCLLAAGGPWWNSFTWRRPLLD